jgi:hypothetical protein
MPALLRRYRWLLLAASVAAVAVLAVAVTVATGRHVPNLARIVASPAAASPAPGGAARAKPGRQPAPHPRQSDPPSGILNTQVGPFGSSTFTVRNAWRGPVGSSWVFAYAGAAPAQPGLRLYTTDDGDEPTLAMAGFFSAPNADSPLTIAESSGSVLTLRTDSGHIYHFDLQTRRYL